MQLLAANDEFQITVEAALALLVDVRHKLTKNQLDKKKGSACAARRYQAQILI
jgi:hypothetical protein